jgi:SPP1 gp7 family putative phage head morphogenesis protein
LYKNTKAPNDLDGDNFSDDSKNISKFTDGIYEDALILGFTTIVEDVGSSILWNVSDPEALAFLTMKNLEIKGIIQTIKDQIHAELIEAYQKGETIDEIAARIRSVFNISNSRAKTIARTEIIGAANAGRGLAISRSGFKEKEWFTAMDEKVRSQHQLQHGKTVKVGHPWVMSDGSSLRFPGDPNGPAHQVINCRCIEVVVPGTHYLQET